MSGESINAETPGLAPTKDFTIEPSRIIVVSPSTKVAVLPVLTVGVVVVVVPVVVVVVGPVPVPVGAVGATQFTAVAVVVQVVWLDRPLNVLLTQPDMLVAAINIARP